MQRFTNTFSIKFYCRASRVASDGTSPIELAINLQGERFRSKRPSSWRALFVVSAKSGYTPIPTRSVELLPGPSCGVSGSALIIKKLRDFYVFKTRHNSLLTLVQSTHFRSHFLYRPEKSLPKKVKKNGSKKLPGDAASPSKDAARILLRSSRGEPVETIRVQYCEDKDTRDGV